MDNPQPILLLDVDGVLCPFSRTKLRTDEDSYPGFEFDPQNFIYTSMTLADYVYQLMDHFEIHWCTGWIDRANDVVSPRMGLPSFPWVQVSGRPEDPHWKWDSIRKHIRKHGNRPYAFIDDEITDEAIEFVRASGEPHKSSLWVPTLCDEGLNLGHVHRLINWANALPVPV